MFDEWLVHNICRITVFEVFLPEPKRSGVFRDVQTINWPKTWFYMRTREKMLKQSLLQKKTRKTKPGSAHWISGSKGLAHTDHLLRTPQESQMQSREWLDSWNPSKPITWSHRQKPPEKHENKDDNLFANHLAHLTQQIPWTSNPSTVSFPTTLAPRHWDHWQGG